MKKLLIWWGIYILGTFSTFSHENQIIMCPKTKGVHSTLWSKAHSWEKSRVVRAKPSGKGDAMWFPWPKWTLHLNLPCTFSTTCSKNYAFAPYRHPQYFGGLLIISCNVRASYKVLQHSPRRPGVTRTEQQMFFQYLWLVCWVTTEN